MISKEHSGTKPWLQYYDEGVPNSIDYPSVPLDKLLEDSAAKHPDHPAMIFGGSLGSGVLDSSISYNQLDESVNRFAAAVQALGIKKGDRIAIFMPNCPQFVIAYYGAMRAGGIAVPANFLYTAAEIQNLLNDSGAEIIITLSTFYNNIDSIRENTKLRHIVVTNVKEYFPSILRLYLR